MFNFDNSYSRLPSNLFAEVKPTPVAKPELLLFNDELAGELGLTNLSLANKQDIFSGNKLAQGSKPIAQAYAGHQFSYPNMLGDGRAVLLGEQISPDGERFDIQLKGSGRTPFSRNGDGRAALAPMLREYIISESLHALGVPTARTLAVVKTGELVRRDRPLPGAIATRVAASHIRVGTFQYAAWHKDENLLISLFNYAAKRHYPQVLKSENPALAFLQEVMLNQIKLVVNWLRIGFIHGVLNTDNVTISGQAIDFGPCAFMDAYDPNTVFSSIDTQGRYAFNRQPAITHWNLQRLAEALLPLIDADEQTAINLATDVLESFMPIFSKQWQQMMRGKLGLYGEQSDDIQLINDWLDLLHRNSLDFTNAHRQLMSFHELNADDNELVGLADWHTRWYKRVSINKDQAVLLMQKNNPMVIPRNHLVEQALNSAQDKNDLQPFNELFKVLQTPYLARDLSDIWCQPAQAHERILQTYCGT